MPADTDKLALRYLPETVNQQLITPVQLLVLLPPLKPGNLGHPSTCEMHQILGPVDLCLCVHVWPDSVESPPVILVGLVIDS